MSIFSSILKGVTGPFRGIAKFAQGDVKGGLGAFGSTAKLAAPVLAATGIGAPAAGVIGGLGGAAEQWSEGGNVLTGALGGAAGGVAPAAVGDVGGLSGISKWVTDNPELALGAASTAANVYGAHQAGSAYDREFALREEEQRRRAKIEPLELLFSAYRGY